MAFDFKKEYKEFYAPKSVPTIVSVPPMNYLAVKGSGDPNEENGEYIESIELLYGIAYTLKMSHKGSHKIDGFVDYVMPPLEGFWWQENIYGADYSKKESFKFISLIRLPDFISKSDFEWAIAEATKKKKQDFSKVEFLTYDEGLCVQCLHIGSYNSEPETIKKMRQHILDNDCELDFSTRYHHEIYLSNPRKTDVTKLKTVIRHPIKLNNKS